MSKVRARFITRALGIPKCKRTLWRTAPIPFRRPKSISSPSSRSRTRVGIILHAADALIFGTPTYIWVRRRVQGVHGQDRAVLANRPWKDKLAAAFTNSGSQHGERTHDAISLTVFAAQHGMNWINRTLLPGHNSSKGSAEDPNRFGGFLGAMAQSNMDEGPEVAPPSPTAGNRLSPRTACRRSRQSLAEAAPPSRSLLNSYQEDLFGDVESDAGVRTLGDTVSDHHVWTR